jgi:hypothetical protein
MIYKRIFPGPDTGFGERPTLWWDRSKTFEEQATPELIEEALKADDITYIVGCLPNWMWHTLAEIHSKLGVDRTIVGMSSAPTIKGVNYIRLNPFVDQMLRLCKSWPNRKQPKYKFVGVQGNSQWGRDQATNILYNRSDSITYNPLLPQYNIAEHRLGIYNNKSEFDHEENLNVMSQLRDIAHTFVGVDEWPLHTDRSSVLTEKLLWGFVLDMPTILICRSEHNEYLKQLGYKFTHIPTKYKNETDQECIDRWRTSL